MLFTFFLVSFAGVIFSDLSVREFMDWKWSRGEYEVVVPADPESIYAVYAVDRSDLTNVKILTDRRTVKQPHYFESLEINCTNMSARTVASGNTYYQFTASIPSNKYTPIPRRSVKYSFAKSVCQGRIKLIDACYM